jgi:hypothetical protein
MRELETPRGNAVCVGCHTNLRDVAAQRAHSHHAPDGEAGPCIACHMARKNISLESGLSRYHRIGSPTDPLRVLGDRPLECALCHADASVEMLVTTMERWWNKAYDREALLKLYGDLRESAVVATLRRGKPHEEAAALATVEAHPKRDVAPLVARQLASEYPLVRELARGALSRMLGAPCDVPLEADLVTIERTATACLVAAGMTPEPWPAPVVRKASDTEPPED